jgi:hypothetical protein
MTNEQRQRFSINIIDEIINDTKMTDLEKTDQLLELDCMMYANLGTDSSSEDRDFVKKTSAYIYRSVKRINNSLGDQLMYAFGIGDEPTPTV